MSHTIHTTTNVKLVFKETHNYSSLSVGKGQKVRFEIKEIIIEFSYAEDRLA